MKWTILKQNKCMNHVQLTTKFEELGKVGGWTRNDECNDYHKLLAA